MHYFLARNGIIENRIVWDGESEYDPGEGAKLIPVDALPEARVGDVVPEPAPEESAEDAAPLEGAEDIVPMEDVEDTVPMEEPAPEEPDPAGDQ